MLSKSSSYVSKYNRHYYNTYTKIQRQLSNKIEKEKEQYSLTISDKNNYQSEWVTHLNQFDWSHFVVLNEDLLTSNLNKKAKEINKKIVDINKGLAKEYQLPLQPLKARSLKALQNYTEKYFKFLIHRKLVDRVVYTFEQDKKGQWHVHALINLYKEDIFIERIKEFWLLSETPYVELIIDLAGSLIYISKSFAKYNFSKIKNIENYNILGDFTNKFNPLRNKYMKDKELKNKELNKEEKSKLLKKFKDKYNLNVIVNEKFIANQKRLHDKYVSYDTAV